MKIIGSNNPSNPNFPLSCIKLCLLLKTYIYYIYIYIYRLISVHISTLILGVPEYKNGLDCAVRTVKAEGPGALFKGFGAFYIKLAPYTTIVRTNYALIRAIRAIGVIGAMRAH